MIAVREGFMRFWLRGIRTIAWQGEDEPCGSLLRAIETDVAAVLAGQAPRRRQTEAPAPPRQGSRIERIKELLALVRRRTRAAIFYNEFEILLGRRLHATAGPAAGPCRFHRIAEPAFQGPT